MTIFAARSHRFLTSRLFLAPALLWLAGWPLTWPPLAWPPQTSSPAALASTAGATPPARWTWPIQPPPEVVHGFAPPRERWLPGHRGVDLATIPGSPVLAAGAGIVTYAGLLAGRGVVVVAHGELRTTYEPVIPSVLVGQQVATGETIGEVAATAGHCSPDSCLHWGLRQADRYLDPLALLGAGRPRLLPLGEVALTPGLLDDRQPDPRRISRNDSPRAAAAVKGEVSGDSAAADSPGRGVLALAAGTTAAAAALVLGSRMGLFVRAT